MNMVQPGSAAVNTPVCEADASPSTAVTVISRRSPGTRSAPVTGISARAVPSSPTEVSAVPVRPGPSTVSRTVRPGVWLSSTATTWRGCSVVPVKSSVDSTEVTRMGLLRVLWGSPILHGRSDSNNHLRVNLVVHPCMPGRGHLPRRFLTACCPAMWSVSASEALARW